MIVEQDVKSVEPRVAEGTPPATIEERGVLSAMDVVRRQNNASRLAWVMVLLAIAAIATLFTPWQQFVSGSGEVKALNPVQRQQTIDAPVDGQVVKWHVIEGTRVKKGDLIVEIADTDPNFVARLEEQIRAVEGRLDAARDRGTLVERRIGDLTLSRDSQLSAARARVETARDRVRQAEQNREAIIARLTQNELQLRRRKEGFAGGVASQRELEVAQADFDTARADLRRADASLNEAKNALKAQEDDLKRADADTTALLNAERGAAASVRAEIETQRLTLQDYNVRRSRQALQQVRAPADGAVFRLLVQPNAAILKAGEAIAEFVPDVQQTMVELFVSGNDMPLITPGRRVRMQFEGWPAVPFVGWPSTAIGTFGGIVYLVDPTNRDDGKFRIMVVPDGTDQQWPSQRFLRQGVRANGWVMLDQVPLGWELWRRLNGFPQVVQDVKDKEFTPKDRKVGTK